MTAEAELTRQEDQGLIVTGTVELPVSIDQAVEEWTQYQELVRRLLDASDYQTIQGRKFTKKSAWRKLARAFNIADQIVDRHLMRDEVTGRVVEADFLVRATAPNGRYAEGWASCSIYERGHEEDKQDYNGKVTCKGPCNGRKHFSNPDHDVPATAHTRAKNRSIADLIGAGEVSAEEVEQVQAARAPKKKPVTEAKAKDLDAKLTTTERGKWAAALRSKAIELGWTTDALNELMETYAEEDEMTLRKVAEFRNIIAEGKNIIAEGKIEPAASPVAETEGDVELEEIAF